MKTRTAFLPFIKVVSRCIAAIIIIIIITWTTVFTTIGTMAPAKASEVMLSSYGQILRSGGRESNNGQHGQQQSPEEDGEY